MPAISTVMSRDDFSKKVEEAVKDCKVSYFDAILLCANEQGLEPELAAKLCDKNIKQMLQSEAEDLNLIERSARLPL